MSSSASSVPAGRRVLNWLSRAEPDTGGPATPHRGAVQRQLFDDIGELIFAHALTPSPHAYAVAHAYLSGEDVTTAAAVTERLRDHGALTDEAVERIAAGGGEERLAPDTLAQIAAALEQRIADCLASVDRSRGSAETFGTALGHEATRLTDDPAATLQRILSLTNDAVATTRLVAAQLRHAQGETDRLRADLQHARRAAERDHLTGLPNRRCFEARLHELQREGNAAGAIVALCDIDDFKQINDRFGHPAGDRVLRFVARFLRTQLGRRAFVARYGGEEFACLFTRSTPDAAHAALDIVRERLSTRSLINQDTGQQIGHVTFSAGITRFDAADPLAALRRADLALYGAKGEGKNRVLLVD